MKIIIEVLSGVFLKHTKTSGIIPDGPWNILLIQISSHEFIPGHSVIIGTVWYVHTELTTKEGNTTLVFKSHSNIDQLPDLCRGSIVVVIIEGAFNPCIAK